MPSASEWAGGFSGKIGAKVAVVEATFGTGGGAANAGIACLIRTGGAIFTGRGCMILGWHVEEGGAEYTGTAVLIVTGGAIPL